MKRYRRLFAVMLACVMLLGIGLTGCSGGGENNTLSAPASVSYSDGTLTWGAVDGAEEYEVTVYNYGETTVALETQTVTTTELSVGSLSAGEYTAGIIAKAEGKTSSSETKYNFTVAAALEALSTPTGFAYSNDKITWTAVTGAGGYTVYVIGKDSSNVAIAEQTVSSNELDVSSLEAGTYTVSVKANGVSGVSEDSLAAVYDFTVAAAVVKLDTPSGAQVNTAAKTITWTAVSGATGYSVKATTSGGDTLIDTTVTSAELDISEVETDTFTLVIMALAEDSAANSEEYTYAVKIEAVQISAPEDIEADSAYTVLSWSSVRYSDAYRLIIKLDGETVIDDELIETTYDISSLAAGEYTVTVQTLADPDDVFFSDSEVKSTTITISSLGAYEAIENLTIEGGYLVWDANNALGYEVVIIAYGDGNEQALDYNNIKASDNSFMIAATGLTGGYTVSITPKDNRHTTDAGTTVTYDVTLKEIVSYDAEAISRFDGVAPVGEHANVEYVEYNGEYVAKVTPTADGWGRIGSEAFLVNYDSNPVVYIEIAGLEVGGFHAQVQVNSNNYKILDDGARLSNIAVSLKANEASSLSGSNSTILRLGVDRMSNGTANDAVAYYRAARVLYVTDYEPPYEGGLEAVAGFSISNGMDIIWEAVDHAEGYYVSVVKEETDKDITVLGATAQTNITYSARDLAEGTYKITVLAYYYKADGTEVQSAEASYEFEVEYLAKYSAQDIAAFTKEFANGTTTTVSYDSDNDWAIINSDRSLDYGAIGPETGARVNLAYYPFAIVDVVSADEGGYLVRGGWTEDGGSEQTIVLRNDTAGALENTKLYIELWKNPDGGTYSGEGLYSFAMGYRGGADVAQITLSSIKLVQITAVEELVEGSQTPLDAPSNAKESKGVVTADSVSGNKAYTPKYNVTVAEKDGETVKAYENLSSPSVNLAALSLTSGTTYTVTFQAIGDSNYFVDSEEYTVEVAYSAVDAVTSFTNLDFDTMASYNDGSSDERGNLWSSTVDESGAFVSTTTTNSAWCYDFFNIDITNIVNSIDNNYYLQMIIDADTSTAGATVATRFWNPTIDDSTGNAVGVVDTGYGEQTVSSTFLTKDWTDKITDENIIWFAIGHGGTTVEGVNGKVVVCTGLKFVKFVLSEVTE